MLCLNALVACFGCATCILTVLNFTTFLSTQTNGHSLTVRFKTSQELHLADDNHVDGDISVLDLLLTLLYDICLVLLFVAQHSLMASQWWKDTLTDIGIITSQRSLYVIGTSWILQVIMGYMEPLPLPPFWFIDTSNSTALWLVFLLIHLVAWLLLYATCIIMDFSEMIGLRQVYYLYLDTDPPLTQKSSATRRLYGHMRHGGATCLLLILWIHPMMTATRVVIATILTTYMMCGFTVCGQDYVYLREQITRKRLTFHMQRTKSLELLQ